jgi:hypothetical protein
MGTAIGAIFGIILTAAIIGMILGGVFMLIGARISDVKDVTLGKAILTSIACGIIAFIISLVFSIIPVIGTIIGFCIGLFIQIFIIKSMFNTDVSKAFLTWIFNLVAQVMAVIIAVMILGTGLVGLGMFSDHMRSRISGVTRNLGPENHSSSRSHP